jgi:hypothetical protein
MKKRNHNVASLSTFLSVFLLFFLLLPGFSAATESTKDVPVSGAATVESPKSESSTVDAPALETSRGRILKVEGDVQVINEHGEVRKSGKSWLLVKELDTIETGKGGKAVVQFTDGALSVLDEKSRLRIEKTNWLSHLGGKIYFTFRKVFGEPRKVKSKFATIGVRGTTFIVQDDEKGKGVALQEGQLEVESPGEAFEIHKQKAMSEFEAFKQQAKDKKAALKDEYSKYKKKTMKEFVEYKKSFTLESNHVIRFDGNRVDESEMGEDTKAEFDDFEAVAGEMLLEFRQQSKEHREKQEYRLED